ncbi:MAG TPA: aminopeptidase [bacterium]|nr:aminopeptidase [bacterium]
MDAVNPDLARVARRILSTCIQIKRDHRVCVVADRKTLPFGLIFAEAAEPLAGDVVLTVMAVRRTHGEEPPAAVAAAMETADVVIQPVTYALTHTDASRRALAKGAAILVLRGITEDLMLGGAMDADYGEIQRTTAALADRLTGAATAHVTSPAGTDVRMGLAGRQGFVLAGRVPGPGRFAGIPDGEAPIAPVEGTTEGTIVVEYSMDDLGMLDGPIRLTVEGGRITAVGGGRSAGRLRRLLDESDEHATNIAEFAIGTNPRARLIGNLAEDKKLRGSVHFAMGDNMSLGGRVRSNIHLDAMVLRPTVTLDGEAVVRDGALTIADAAPHGGAGPREAKR